MLLALAAVHALSILLDVTFEEATNFYGNRALHDGDLAGLRALLRLSLKVDIAIGVVVTALVVALSGVLADIASAGELDPTLVQISALSVLVTTADSTAFAALALARRVDLRARALAATSALRLIGVIIAVQLGGAEAVAISYVLGGAAGSLVLATVRVARGLAPWAPESGSEPERRPVGTRELVRFGFHSSLTTQRPVGLGDPRAGDPRPRGRDRRGRRLPRREAADHRREHGPGADAAGDVPRAVEAGRRRGGWPRSAARPGATRSSPSASGSWARPSPT